MCLNFGSNLAAAMSVCNRGCSVVGCSFQFSRVPGLDFVAKKSSLTISNGPERKAIADAQKIVAIWNAPSRAGRALWFYPTIAVAILLTRLVCCRLFHGNSEGNASNVRALHESMRGGVGQFPGVCAPSAQI